MFPTVRYVHFFIRNLPSLGRRGERTTNGQIISYFCLWSHTHHTPTPAPPWSERERNIRDLVLTHHNVTLTYNVGELLPEDLTVSLCNQSSRHCPKSRGVTFCCRAEFKAKGGEEGVRRGGQMGRYIGWPLYSSLRSKTLWSPEATFTLWRNPE